uniref:Uncharacterized protein n=1 Tax=Setaria italica TaxID=4555 RepID=K3Y3V7_SETIT
MGRDAHGLHLHPRRQAPMNCYLVSARLQFLNVSFVGSLAWRLLAFSAVRVYD